MNHVDNEIVDAVCITQFRQVQADNAKLRAACEDVARQLFRMGERLQAPVRPGHCDYISKSDAGAWAIVLTTELSAALGKDGAT